MYYDEFALQPYYGPNIYFYTKHIECGNNGTPRHVPSEWMQNLVLESYLEECFKYKTLQLSK